MKGFVLSIKYYSINHFQQVSQIRILVYVLHLHRPVKLAAFWQCAQLKVVIMNLSRTGVSPGQVSNETYVFVEVTSEGTQPCKLHNVIQSSQKLINSRE